MRVKLEWLQELVDLTGIETREIIQKLSLYSVEVEGVEKLIDASNIVVGHVLTKVPHPDSDHLNVLTVDVKEEVLQIVCGAPNVEAGQYVIVALVGAVLPGNFKIKKSKIRGVESCGMVCSLQELGIEKKFVSEKYSEGIYYFEESVELGTHGAEALNLADEVIELGITPNRGDLLSMIGVAYEMSALFNRALKPLVYDLVRSNIESKVEVKLETEGCITYYAQEIRDVEIKPSPKWLTSRLLAFGIRSINNCVDITNYILALFGQPLHSFDKDKLGDKIVVRNALEGEEIITLDNLKRELVSTDVVITNGKTPVAIAGVMGGLDTEVREDTKNLVIEAAVFDPLSVRKTSSRLGLRSESSIRFERGVDANRTKAALDYASFLYKTLANGRVAENVTVAGSELIPGKVIELDHQDITSLLGAEIPMTEIASILESLGFEVTVENKIIKVLVPNRRPDIAIKEDIIEEVGRIYGYDLLPSTLPEDRMVGELTDRQKEKRLIRQTLTSLGLHETVTYSLVNLGKNQLFTTNHTEGQSPIELLMPLSEDRAILRYGLLPSLVEVAKYNFSRKNEDLALFEIGSVYSHDPLKETTVLAGVMANRYNATLWKGEVEVVDFYVVKGILEVLFERLGIVAEYRPLERVSKELHPNRSASIVVDGREVGFLAQVHPKFALREDVEGLYCFEIKLDELLSSNHQKSSYKEVSKLPSVERDLALVVKKNVLASDLVDAIKKSEKVILSDVIIFDVYEGDKVADDEKSIAIKLVFTSDTALTDEVIATKIKKILKDLNYRYQAVLRA